MKYLAIFLIRAYQILASPFLGGGIRCRFRPTCSEYALQAIKDFGIIRGAKLALARIMRCRPGGGRGYDPVPEREKPWKKT
ncbi:MAG: membrane protein insertion efficiency factor YidD [Rickettsiales bacterium]|jgi:putative membrane protein insertion efficiency factor|nr:membrane protein insertion efficiency factor YidD [Rickettsiales bacterium]